MSGEQSGSVRSPWSRRRFLALAPVGVGLAACAMGGQPQAAPTVAAPTARPAGTGAAGAAPATGGIPADAAPPEQQTRIVVWNAEGAKAEGMDFMEGVYNRAGNADLFTEPLVRLTKDFTIVPGVANKWEASADGKTWTFTLDKGLMWSDGNEVTADDFVETFRYSADPKHAWDFTWYWSGVIKNYTEATKGSVTTDQIGVRAGADKYSLVFETVDPVPYLPAQLLYSWPLSKAGLMKYGSGKYNTNPGSAITMGPYTLTEWSPDRRFVVKANPKYTGKLKPIIQQLIANVVRGGSDFQRYQAGEIDTATISSPADIKLIQADPNLAKQFYTNPQDFRTFYLFFDVNTPPWDNLKVRQALSHAVDRDAIIKAILAPLAVPAYSFLMPGFPDANSEGLKSIQSYDPQMAKQLLADAGYPNGQGFPKTTLYVRPTGSAPDGDVTQAIAANFKQVLGIDVALENQDSPTFMASLNAKPTKIPFGWISYGMDFFDATNMLGVWVSGGRHSWKNDQFDNLVKQGGSLSGNPGQRSDMMKSAEKILVSDVPGIFVYHQLVGQLFKPYVKGEILTPNKYGFNGEQWPGFGTATLAIAQEYISKDVTQYRKS